LYKQSLREAKECFRFKFVMKFPDDAEQTPSKLASFHYKADVKQLSVFVIGII